MSHAHWPAYAHPAEFPVGGTDTLRAQPGGPPPLHLRGPRTEDQLRMLAYEVTVAEARERERIALGLHDDIGQVLAILAMKLDALRHAGDGADAAERAAQLVQMRELVGQALQATRCATFDLSSPVLHQLGLQAAIESLVPRTERLAGIKVSLHGELPALALPQQVQAVVFRVLRELLANMSKHARAGEARITLHADAERLLIALADDGVGFDADRPRVGFGPHGGYGLFSAEAQIEAVGGRLDIESAPGRGTRATILLPLQPVVAEEAH
ncbi:MAG: sensor histidine kinase [Pseudomonadota bacterium]